MVEKQLLKLSKSNPIFADYEVKTTTASPVTDEHLLTVYALKPSINRANDTDKQVLTSLLSINLFDQRQIEETATHEVCWPYLIRSVAVNPSKKSITLLCQSLIDEDESSEASRAAALGTQANAERTVIFDFTIEKLLVK